VDKSWCVEGTQRWTGILKHHLQKLERKAINPFLCILVQKCPLPLADKFFKGRQIVGFVCPPGRQIIDSLDSGRPVWRVVCPAGIKYARMV